MAQAPALMQFLIVVLAAWLARQQEAFIEYLKAENRMLKARLGRRRIVFSDAERRLLARHAKAVGRKKLFELGPIVSPDTLLRWHRHLIAMKRTFLRKGPGRPRVMGTIEALVVRWPVRTHVGGTRAFRARSPILGTRSPVERSRTS
jgi:putative transposase